MFHLHYHTMPRHAGVAMGPPGNMGDMDEIAANAARIRAAQDSPWLSCAPRRDSKIGLPPRA